MVIIKKIAVHLSLRKSLSSSLLVISLSQRASAKYNHYFIFVFYIIHLFTRNVIHKDKVHFYLWKNDANLMHLDFIVYYNTTKNTLTRQDVFRFEEYTERTKICKKYIGKIHGFCYAFFYC